MLASSCRSLPSSFSPRSELCSKYVCLVPMVPTRTNTFESTVATGYENCKAELMLMRNSQGHSGTVMGGHEDPEDGGAVAGAVFGAVFIYIVRWNQKRVSHLANVFPGLLCLLWPAGLPPHARKPSRRDKPVIILNRVRNTVERQDKTRSHLENLWMRRWHRDRHASLRLWRKGRGTCTL